MAFCLPKFAAEALIKALPEDLSKLTDISSTERRAFFAKVVGEENAKQMNALFESKLILKDQQQGIINWVKKVTGMTPEVKRDIISRVNNMSEVLQPDDANKFLSDLVDKKLGFGVTVEEAGRIADLAKTVEDNSAVQANGGRTPAYGEAVVNFHNYVNDLKLNAEKAKPTSLYGKVSKFAGITKSLKATGDLSALLRQGWNTLLTHPGVWAENAVKNIGNVVKSLGGKEVMDAVNAEIISRPNYERALKGKLAIGVMEEAYPQSLPEKIPLFGRLFKASEVSFKSFLQQTRMDLFDKYLEIADKSGVNIDDRAQLKSIASMVNSLTGRASLPLGLEKIAGGVNNVFFSPRNTAAHFDVLTAHQFEGGVTPFVRKQAALNLTKIIVAQAAIIAIANAIQPNSVELDPRSSDFGKIKVGTTRFDITGGAGSLVVLAAKELAKSTKSSTTGKIAELNSGKYGSQTRGDVLWNFFENKLSPVASVVNDTLIRGTNFQGTKPTVANEAANLLIPLPIQNPMQTLGNPKAAPLLLIMIADGLGIGANTYNTKK